MKRRTFLRNSLTAGLAMTSLSTLARALDRGDSTQRMPVLFVGHGSPMNALEDNAFTRQWREVAHGLPTPKAILCVSAHWETRGTKVTAMAQPKTIHDFYGFPQALNNAQYPAAGSPEMAQLVAETLKNHAVGLDQEWGLDHGTWSVLMQMYPKADIPVFQLSLNRNLQPQAHYDLARELQPLREKGLLIVGSGNVVHNLRMMQISQGGMADNAYDWAISFDTYVKESLLKGDHQSLCDAGKWGREGQLAVPTAEHYLPMLYAAGLQRQGEELQFFNEFNVGGSISMRSFLFG